MDDLRRSESDGRLNRGLLFPAAAAWLAALAAFAHFTAAAPESRRAVTGPDWSAVKASLRGRVLAARARGVLPILDVESSYGPPSGDPGQSSDWLARVEALTPLVEEAGLAGIAFSPGAGDYPELAGGGPGPAWAAANRALARRLPWFLPVPAAGDIARRRDAAYRREIFAEARAGAYPMMGEFFFRHYPSNKQLSGPASGDSDYDVPLDGPGGNEIFRFAQARGAAFQIHYEPEDRLFPALEKQLAGHPGARLIWAHFGRVRAPRLAAGYTPEWIEGLLARYPNLYFDTSGSGPGEKYGPSRALVSVIWDRKNGGLKPEWKAVIERNPWRFLCALDLGSERSDPERFRRAVAGQRALLAALSPEAAEIVAYKAAWRLIFGEEFPGQ